MALAELAAGTVAYRVAKPVLARESCEGVVRGVGRAAAYVDFDGFVVAVTRPGVALMPNGVALGTRPPELGWARPGARVSLAPGRLGDVVWEAAWPPVWESRLCAETSVRPEALRARGAEILVACGLEAKPDPAALARAFNLDAEAAAVALLLGSVASRDAAPAADAAELLIGRGPGLTPVGDDVIAAAAGVASIAGWSEGELRAWREAVLPGDLRSRTTALSATLLELAGRGEVIEPVHGLLDGDAGDARWRSAVHRLVRIGASTGGAYAAAAGATAFLGAA
ncbi:MAG: hypothetical protein QOJ25_1605 [Solirubrobacteraceae bacterium]|nr:hypothetical protein [Solirubrobacteraceae bacterium]